MASNGQQTASNGPPTTSVPPFPIGATQPGGPPPRTQSKLEPGDYQRGHKSFPRISRPVELLRSSYDVVVIGSGYGGGVAASRMARAGQSVCILERGKERWPGEYPSNLAEASPEISVSGLFAPNGHFKKRINIGDPAKMYHLVIGDGQNAFVASGLGGTSLLNANVFLEADAGTMSLPTWPEDLKRKGALREYYDRAASMLQPESYPEDFPTLRKLEVLKKQAELLGWEDKFYRVPQTTRFQNGPNNVGVNMMASTLTGMDCTGVNDGSKSSTLVNYLSDAWNWGAEIFCECEVRYVKKHPTQEGYLVYFAWHGSNRGLFKDHIYRDLMWVHAKKFLFLGAGTLGSTEILLRSKSLGMPMSSRVGVDMSGNGDILAFGYNTDKQVNGMGRSYPHQDYPIGPTITGVIDCRKQNNPLDGFVIEEGAIPESLVPVLQSMLQSLPGKIYPKKFGIPERLRHLGSRIQSWFYTYAPGGSLQRTQTYLIMSHDSNQAVMTLKDDKPELTWLGVGRSDHVTYLNGILAKATSLIGGTFINSPFFAVLGQQEITVHPIGGASISFSGTGLDGVVNQYGQVFKGDGDEVYDGLVVVDGSVIPTALGVNPFATITALAERSVEAAAKRHDLEIDFDTKNGILDLFDPPAHSQPMSDELRQADISVRVARYSNAKGIEFTEVMAGFLYTEGPVNDFAVADEAAKAAGSTARFFLSCHAWNIDQMVELETHPAMVNGTFTCSSLPGSPFMVQRGTLNFFNEDPRTPDTSNLTYDFDMISTHGETYHFHGYKIVDRSSLFSFAAVWKATTTLYVTITKDQATVGKGILEVKYLDVELQSMIDKDAPVESRISSVRKMFSFFSRQLIPNLLGPFAPLQYPAATTGGYVAGKKPPMETRKITSLDGFVSTLQRWAPTTIGQNPPPKVFFIPGAAVDHQIFALPTIKTNAVEYFQDAGFEVFCITHRVGKSPNANQGSTTYDARLDIQAAFRAIHQIQGNQDPIYVVAHCAGSGALSCGLLDGTILPSWISGITASQVFFNPIFGTVNKIKATLPIPMTSIYKLLAGSWFSCISTAHDTIVQRLINQITRFYPVGRTSEFCNSVVCHRSSLVFGRLWSHGQLNDATHDNLSQFLGGTSMTSLDQLVYMGSHGFVVDNKNKSLVTDQNLQRLKGIPIQFFSGSENVVYSPESTDKSYTTLTNAFGQEGYNCEVIQGYGHLDCWMGRDAVKDVYPMVLRHALKHS